MIQKAGGKVTDTVSNKTDFIVVGADGRAKLQKAQSLEINQLDEANLLEILMTQEPGELPRGRR